MTRNSATRHGRHAVFIHPIRLTGRSSAILVATMVWCPILIGIIATSAWGKDYAVHFLNETYKAEPSGETGAGKVYHTWAVETEFGKKLLVLKGEDRVLREWLREFTKDHQQFLATVPDDQSGAFELKTVVDIDVANLHPITENFLETGTDKDKKGTRGNRARKK